MIRANRRQRSSSAVVIGAGPNGLAAAVHLRAAGLEIRCFGEPLEFWCRHMPEGMLLRSRKRSTHIADPQRTLTIDHYERAEHKHVRSPSLRLEEFIDYGGWFQRRAVDVDRRRVAALSREDGIFRLRLGDGEEVTAATVVVAAGIEPFAYRPAPFANLPSSLVSHSFDHNDLATFANQRVLVIGAGQSALESAALLSESGADVELLTRAGAIHWLSTAKADERSVDPAPSPLSPPTDVGGGLSGWVAAAPDVFRRMPPARQRSIAWRCTRPAGSGWLRPRLDRVAISYHRSVVSAEHFNDQIRVRLDDGSERSADHVLLGTGYAVDIARYEFMKPELTAAIATSDGYPILGPGLESSVPGLHFVGAPAALSFGPVMRFVVGSWYAAPAVARRAANLPQPRIRFSF